MIVAKLRIALGVPPKMLRIGKPFQFADGQLKPFRQSTFRFNDGDVPGFSSLNGLHLLWPREPICNHIQLTSGVGICAAEVGVCKQELDHVAMPRSGLTGKESNVTTDHWIKPAGWFSKSATGADDDLLLVLISSK